MWVFHIPKFFFGTHLWYTFLSYNIRYNMPVKTCPIGVLRTIILLKRKGSPNYGFIYIRGPVGQYIWNAALGRCEITLCTIECKSLPVNDDDEIVGWRTCYLFRKILPATKAGPHLTELVNLFRARNEGFALNKADESIIYS